MSEEKSSSSGCSVGGFSFIPFAVATAMVGYHIHGSMFWAICDFFFSPFAWAKWMIMGQVNITIIKETFSFFLK